MQYINDLEASVNRLQTDIGAAGPHLANLRQQHAGMASSILGFVKFLPHGDFQWQNDMHAVTRVIGIALRLSLLHEAELPHNRPDVVGWV